MTDAGRTLRWGIIGTGAIARVFARAITDTRSGTIGPVCSRQRPSGESFCDEFGGAPNTDIDAALQDCDALYIATPHSAHRDAAIAALCGGIAVLCEKPILFVLKTPPDDALRAAISRSAAPHGASNTTDRRLPQVAADCPKSSSFLAKSAAVREAGMGNMGWRGAGGGHG